jgi:hypothetical protein
MISRTKTLCVVLAGVWMAVLALPQACAQDGTEAAVKADKTGTNPMNFTYDARVYNEFQWLNTKGDGHQNVTTLELRVPFADGKWQFRGRVRGVDLAADLNDDGSDDLNETGMGDSDFRLMTIPYMSKKGAVALGTEFFFDTASEDELGAGSTTVAPLVFLAYFNPIGKGSILVPGYQHLISVEYDEGRDQVHQGLIDLFLVKTFANNQIWGYVDPQILLDYENNKEFMLLEIQAGTMLDKLLPFKGHSVYVMPSFGVGADRPYDVSVEAGYKVVW